MLTFAAPSKLSLGYSFRHQKTPKRCTTVSAAEWDPLPRAERLIKAGVPQQQALAHVDVVSNALNFAVGTLRKDIADLTKEVRAFKQEVIVARLRTENKTDVVEQEIKMTRLDIENEAEMTRLHIGNKLDELGTFMNRAAAVIIFFLASIFAQTDIVKTFIAWVLRG
ncbi:g4692 [Coccomyxa elongata]